MGGGILAGLWCLGCIVFIIWRTEQYLRGPRTGPRSSLSMSVGDGRIHFKGRDRKLEKA